MENDETLFYAHRDRFNAMLAAAVARAAKRRALLLPQPHGYNGLCRFNRYGGFNVPFGQYTRIAYTRDFTPYREVFARWTFTAGDLESVPLEPGDFVYADPPYDVDFTAYAQGGFSWDDQVRAADVRDAPRPGRARQSVHPAYRRVVSQARLCRHGLEAPCRIELQRRSHSGEGNLRDTESVTLRWLFLPPQSRHGADSPPLERFVSRSTSDDRRIGSGISRGAKCGRPGDGADWRRHPVARRSHRRRRDELGDADPASIVDNPDSASS